LYTGAGQPGCLLWGDNESEQDLINIFDPSMIHQTFAAFLGVYPAYPDIVYKVHGDVPKSPEIVISYSQHDIDEGIGFWGVYRHAGTKYGGSFKDNVEEIKELSAKIFETSTFASVMVDEINTRYPEQINIVCFVSCRVAIRQKRRRPKHFEESVASFLAASHFSVGESRDMDAYAPNAGIEDYEKKPLHITIHGYGVHFLLGPDQRNVFVSELLDSMKRANKLSQEVTGFYIMSPGYSPIENEALLSGQLRQSYLVQKDGEYSLELFPSFSRNAKTRRSRTSKTIHPNTLLNTEVRRKTRKQTGSGKLRKHRQSRGATDRTLVQRNLK
jgi:hypothetical protein